MQLLIFNLKFSKKISKTWQCSLMPTSKLPETVCLWYFYHSLIVSESCRGRHFDFIGRLFSSPRISVGRMKKTSQGHSWGSLCSMGPLSTNFSQNDSIAAKLKVESLKRESITIDWYKTIRQHTPNDYLTSEYLNVTTRIFNTRRLLGNIFLGSVANRKLFKGHDDSVEAITV